MSFTYLPGISKLNINLTTKKILQSSLSIRSIEREASLMRGSSDVLNGNDNIDLSEERIGGGDSFSDYEKLLVAINYAPPGYNFACTMQRRKTALQTTYRLYIEGCHSLQTEGAQINRIDSQNVTENPQIDPFLATQLSLKGFVLCAGKQKGSLSLSPTYHIWSPANHKEWKEKISIGRLSRSNGIYSGYLTDYCQELLASSASPLPHDVLTNKRNISIRVLSGGLDKLIHVVAVAQIDLPHSALLPPPPSESSSPKTKDVPDESTSESPSPPPPPPPPNIESENTIESTLLQTVENICSKTPIPQPSQNIIAFQSRRPKKFLSKAGDRSTLAHSSLYTISYGEKGRVKNPSRKNIVMDKISLSSPSSSSAPTLESETFEPEWMCGDPSPSGGVSSPASEGPLLQCGKMSEDVFSLDFTELTPFQAFVVALSVFDN